MRKQIIITRSKIRDCLNKIGMMEAAREISTDPEKVIDDVKASVKEAIIPIIKTIKVHNGKLDLNKLDRLIQISFEEVQKNIEKNQDFHEGVNSSLKNGVSIKDLCESLREDEIPIIVENGYKGLGFVTLLVSREILRSYAIKEGVALGLNLN